MGELDGEHHYDSRKHVLEWRLPVIDASNKNGSLEFSIAGMAGDFFPIKVSFLSTKSYCNIEVGGREREREGGRGREREGEGGRGRGGGKRIEVGGGERGREREAWREKEGGRERKGTGGREGGREWG